MKIKTKLITAVSVFAAIVTVACGSIAVGAAGMPSYDNKTVRYQINTVTQQKHNFYLYDESVFKKTQLAKISESAMNYWWYWNWNTKAWLWAGPNLADTYVKVKTTCTYVNGNGNLRRDNVVNTKKCANRATEQVFSYDVKDYSSCTNLYVQCYEFGQTKAKNGTKVSTSVRAFYS